MRHFMLMMVARFCVPVFLLVCLVKSCSISVGLKFSLVEFMACRPKSHDATPSQTTMKLH